MIESAKLPPEGVIESTSRAYTFPIWVSDGILSVNRGFMDVTSKFPDSSAYSSFQRGFKNIISNVIKLLRRLDTDLSLVPLELLIKKCKKN